MKVVLMGGDETSASRPRELAVDPPADSTKQLSVRGFAFVPGGDAVPFTEGDGLDFVPYHGVKCHQRARPPSNLELASRSTGLVKSKHPTLIVPRIE
jgi:hypothetical protein